MTVTYDQIIEVLREKLEPLEFVHAMFEGGSVAFGRFDEYSDIDLQLTVDDGREQETFGLVEKALETLTPISHKLEIPQPAWHGYHQAFYRLKDTTEYLLIDLLVRNLSEPDRLMELEQHGEPKVHFDKRDLTRPTRLDLDRHSEMLKGRVERIKTMFEMFQCMTTKDLNRGNPLGAIYFYQGMTLKPLTELLGIRYCPLRYNFSQHYSKFHMPEDVVAELTSLHFVTDADDLWDKLKRARELFSRTLAEIDPDNIL